MAFNKQNTIEWVVNVQGKNILFVSYGGQHARVISSAFNYIKREIAYVNSIAFGAASGSSFFKELGLGCFDYDDLVLEKYRSIVEMYGEKLIDENHDIASNLTRKKAINYLGLNYLDQVLEHGQENSAKNYSLLGRNSFLPINSMELLFDMAKPDVLVCTTAPRTELAARVVANRMNIPVVVLADTINPLTTPNPLVADVFCVPSQLEIEDWTNKDWIKVKKIACCSEESIDVPNSVRNKDSINLNPKKVCEEIVSLLNVSKTG